MRKRTAITLHHLLSNSDPSSAACVGHSRKRLSQEAISNEQSFLPSAHLSQTKRRRQQNAMDARTAVVGEAKAMEIGATGEMLEYFDQLAHLVPTLQQNEQVSHVQILQHVIDYILDLETELDMTPSASLSRFAGERRPLVESTNIVTSPLQQVS